ncbi:DNA polymerase, partial [bacterium]|nr:DNA polymerase [bacterium]
PLKWHNPGDLDSVWLCTTDIEILRKFGAVVDVHYGYYWERKTSHMFDYLGPLRDEKTLQDVYAAEDLLLEPGEPTRYNPSLRNMAKCSSNGLGGKMAQQPHFDETCVVTSPEDLQIFLDNHDPESVTYMDTGVEDTMFMTGRKKGRLYNPRKIKPVQIAVFIYAYARAHMYLALLSRIPLDAQYGMDTDAEWLVREIAVQYVQAEAGFGKFHLGGEYGDFTEELDFECEEAVLLARKFYYMGGRDANGVWKEKHKMKGVAPRDKVTMEVPRHLSPWDALQEFQKMPLWDRLTAVEKWPKMEARNTYKKLAEGRPVIFGSRPFLRNLGGDVNPIGIYGSVQPKIMCFSLPPSTHLHGIDHVELYPEGPEYGSLFG